MCGGDWAQLGTSEVEPNGCETLKVSLQPRFYPSWSWPSPSGAPTLPWEAGQVTQGTDGHHHTVAIPLNTSSCCLPEWGSEPLDHPWLWGGAQRVPNPSRTTTWAALTPCWDQLPLPLSPRGSWHRGWDILCRPGTAQTPTSPVPAVPVGEDRVEFLPASAAGKGSREVGRVPQNPPPFHSLLEPKNKKLLRLLQIQLREGHKQVLVHLGSICMLNFLIVTRRATFLGIAERLLEE